VSGSKSLIFISSNTSGTGRLFLEKAARMGLDPVLVCDDPERFAFLRGMHVRVVIADLSDESAVLEAVRRIARRSRVAGVLSSSEYYQVLAARAARALELPGPDPEAVRLCRDKAEQRRRLERASVGQPGFAEARTPGEAAEAAIALGGLAVVKPVDGTGSVGVVLAHGPAEAAAAHRLLVQGVNERGLAVEQRVLIEQYLAGPEYSIELFHGRVIGVTEKRVGPEPYFVEVGHTFPAPLSERGRGRLERVAVEAAQALGLRFGALHVEAKLDGDRAAIVEVNPRLAGGFIPTIVELTGMDLIGAVIAAAASAPPPTPVARFGAAAIRFILPPRDGVLARIAGLNAARKAAGVVEAMAYTRPGQPVARHGDFRDRIGHVIAVGGDADQASAAAATALGRIRVVVNAQTEEVTRVS
jgi:biotin carboxylase